MAIYTKVIGRMIKKNEKELNNMKKVIDMKVILKIIKWKEKAFYIIIMVIEKWEIGKMIKLYNYHYLFNIYYNRDRLK